MTQLNETFTVDVFVRIFELQEQFNTYVLLVESDHLYIDFEFIDPCQFAALTFSDILTSPVEYYVYN